MDVRCLNHLKVNEINTSDVVKLEKRLANVAPEQPIVANQFSLKTEIDINEDIFRTSIENIKLEESWESNFDATNIDLIDPLKLDDRHADEAIIKFEKAGITEFVVQQSKNYCHNIKTEADEGVFRTSKDEKFIQTSKLETHKHSCHVCGKSFSRKWLLNRHTVQHTENRPHICNVCYKAFKYLNNLKAHLIIHTDEKPYSCDICSKSFQRPEGLKRHKLIHAGNKSHICEICDKAFLYASNLIQHKLIHTDDRPHDCNFCNKSFLRLGDLRKHEKKHAGRKLHVCDICRKSFRRITTLRKHSVIHTKEKLQYSCDACGQKFLCAQNLKDHIIDVHS